MAHKKGVGSSDNGRDSKSKRLGLKFLEDKLPLQAILLSDREVPNFTLLPMLAWEKILPYTPSLMVL